MDPRLETHQRWTPKHVPNLPDPLAYELLLWINKGAWPTDKLLLAFIKGGGLPAPYDLLDLKNADKYSLRTFLQLNMLFYRKLPPKCQGPYNSWEWHKSGGWEALYAKQRTPRVATYKGTVIFKVPLGELTKEEAEEEAKLLIEHARYYSHLKVDSAEQRNSSEGAFLDFTLEGVADHA